MIRGNSFLSFRTFIVSIICGLLISNISIALSETVPSEALSVTELDLTNIDVNADGTYTETMERKTLIRSQLAVDSYSQVDIPYIDKFQEVRILKAYTIAPDGSEIPVAKNAIRTVDGDSSDGKSSYSDVKHRIIIFPNVNAGSRIYYKAITITKKPLFPGQYFARYWWGPGTQYDRSEIYLSYNPKITLNIDAVGVQGGRLPDGPNGQIRYLYSYHNNGISLAEPNQISDSDRSPHVHISSFQSQIDFGRAYESRAKDKYKVTPEIQKLADEITKGISDPKDQAKALYFWVSKEIRYVAVYLGADGIVPHPASEVLAARYSDCKGKVTLYLALLSAKGIAGTTALINSGNSYELPKLAVMGPFNHVIAYLPQWDMYVDPTAERAPFEVLPFSDLDKPTVLTGLERIGRTPKPKAKENTVFTTVELTIQEDGQINGLSNTIYTGVEDIRARYAFEGSDSTYGSLMVRENLQAARLTGSGSYKPSLATDLNTPFSLESRFTIDPITNFPGMGAISVPMGLAPAELATLAYSKPPEIVTKPVVCRSRSLLEEQLIHFPSNVRVTAIPKNIEYSQDGIDFASVYTLKGRDVTVKRSMSVQHPSAVCEPNEVEEWKKFVSVLQRDLRSQIFYQ
jgi:transglutaminase-like putative cysteine protease